MGLTANTVQAEDMFGERVTCYLQSKAERQGKPYRFLPFTSYPKERKGRNSHLLLVGPLVVSYWNCKS
ncbi:hypothetical protein Y1Q_0002134 [Alligator mississippiensis]|uniref:Uncharacterized protein n=1 Tax=Alligator mississippiensis TaxID=8496 RepID=A0A151MQ28_ALLMI|nr:hypothetical protein Y1Q_0002134 [Alligator mississippiensis]